MEEGTAIAIAGDWHGNLGWARDAVHSAARHGVRTVLQVGDFGARWPGKLKGRFESRLNFYLQQLDMKLIFIGGNHDNWAELETLPAGENGLAALLSNISYLSRPGRTTVNGLTIGGLSGAFSVDYQFRTEGKDWWANEDVTELHVDKLVQGCPVDVLLTHDVPAGIPVQAGLSLPPEISARANRTRDLLRNAVDAIGPSQVFCGHWHQRLTVLEHRPGNRPTTVHVLDMDGARDWNLVLLGYWWSPMFENAKTLMAS